MHVVCATAQERCTNADATSWLKVPAIAKATNSTPWVYVVVHAKPTKTRMASATTWMTALVNWTHVAYATVLARCTNVDAQTFRKEIVTATATSWMHWASAVEAVRKTSTEMAFATT